MSTFVQPELQVGDRVLYYDNPQGDRVPCKSQFWVRVTQAGGLDHKYFSVRRRRWFC